MSVGEYRHLVHLDAPGDPVPDGDGGYTEGFAPLTPPMWYCAIAPANARDLERIAAGAVVSQASHLVRGPFHQGITTETRITFTDTAYTPPRDRVLNVIAVTNREEREIVSELICAEVIE